MLVTDVGGLAEIVPDGRVGYVTKKDSKSIADAVVRFFTENRETEFAKAVDLEKERFSWSHFAEEFTKFADSVQSRKKKKV
jgi:glycosyltransferase involved in cell wall biosynthesis